MLLSLVLQALLAVPVSLAHASNPWSLQVSHNSRGSGVTMQYRMRFGLSRRAAPAGQARSAAARGLQAGFLGILQSARLELYGVRLKPFDRLIRLPPAEEPASAGAAGSEEPTALSSLETGARREAKRWLVRALFDRVLPQAKAAPGWQKETVVADLAQAGRSWASVP